MSTRLREWGKRIGANYLARDQDRFAFRNCIFIIAHMRCGSTALSNIICSRDDVCGYGEAHIRYDRREAIGQLALNMRRRGGWSANASFFFDKILHSRHDAGAPAAFFSSRAIFMLREPEPAIRSICKLYRDLGRSEYASHALAAAYYAERVNAMAQLWVRFPADLRFGLTHAALLNNPDHVLAQLSARLAITPALENRYVSLAASRKGGGGDPVVSGKHNRIEPALLRLPGALETLDLSDEQVDSARHAFDRMSALIAEQ